MAKLIVALDMDGTIYNLHDPWVKWISREFGVDTSDGLTQWDPATQFPTAGTAIYDFLDIEGMFYGLALFPGALAAIREVATWGLVRQIFVSTCKTRLGSYEKQQAIARDFPDMVNDTIITYHSKDIIKADVLVDDGPHNLRIFPGITVKVPHAYNKGCSSRFILNDWCKYPALINQILDLETAQWEESTHG